MSPNSLSPQEATLHEIYIDRWSYALGEHEGTVEEAAEAGKLLSSPAALREAGFGRHHYCGPTTTAYDLAHRMCAAWGEALEDVDAIVYATSLPQNGTIGDGERYRSTRDVKYLMDFPASHLQADFKMTRAIVLGVNQQACTSLLGAIRMACNLLIAEPHFQKALCLTADRFPEGALYEQAYNLISDGAAGCIVSREPRGYRYLGAHAITNGAMAIASDDETFGSYFNYSHRLIVECLERIGMTVGDIDWIVSQNVNVVTWQVLHALLGIDMERVLCPSMRDVGHVISGDNVINLAILERERRIEPGARVLLPMAGYGLNWQAIALEKR